MHCTISKDTEKLLKCFESGSLSTGETVNALCRIVSRETETETDTGERFRIETAIYKAAFLRILKEIRNRERKRKRKKGRRGTKENN